MPMNPADTRLLRMVFPMEVQSGSVIVKIYKVENKGRDSFTVSYFADRKRKLKMFAVFDEAHAEAKSKAASAHAGGQDAPDAVKEMLEAKEREGAEPQATQRSAPQPNSLVFAWVVMAWTAG